MPSSPCGPDLGQNPFAGWGCELSVNQTSTRQSEASGGTCLQIIIQLVSSELELEVNSEVHVLH